VKNISEINKWFNKIAVVMMAILFWIAMNYVGRNMGGGGIQLPFNNYAWITVSFFILVGLLRVSLFSKLKLTKTYISYCVFVVLLLLPLAYTNRLFLDVESMRLYGIGAGLLFLLILLQFDSMKFKQHFLLILFVSCVIQTVWGLVQYYVVFESHFLFYRADYGFPYGVFQQVNDYVTYITVGSLIAIYYCFTCQSLMWRKIAATTLLLFCNFHLSQLSKADTSGIVALVVVPVYLLYWFWKSRQISIVGLFLVVSVVGAFMPRSWFDVRPNPQALTAESVQVSISGNSTAMTADTVALPDEKPSKPQEETKILQGKVSNEHKLGTRETIYQVALIMILDKPWLGHGIGSFTKQYLLYQGDYLKQHPDAPAEFNIDHPHNEVFLWVIEFGLVALVAFLFLLVTWIYLVRKHQIDIQILLLASPIILHSLLELPMYHSAPHFLLFLSLLFISDSSRKTQFTLPKLSKFVVLPVAFYGFLQIQVFLLSTLYALNMFLHFNANNREPIHYLLQVNNPAAFKLRFEFELFQHKLRKAAKTKQISKQDVTSFIYWAYSVTQYAPIQSTYENFVEALRLIGNNEAALKFANEAVHMYPFNEKLVRYQKELEKKLAIQSQQGAPK